MDGSVWMVKIQLVLVGAIHLFAPPKKGYPSLFNFGYYVYTLSAGVTAFFAHKAFTGKGTTCYDEPMGL